MSEEEQKNNAEDIPSHDLPVEPASSGKKEAANENEDLPEETEQPPQTRFEELQQRMQENAEKIDKMLHGSKNKDEKEKASGDEKKAKNDASKDSGGPTKKELGQDKDKEAASPNKERASNIAESIKGSKDKLAGGLKRGKEITEGLGAAKDMAENAPEYAKELAKKKVKDAMKQAAKKAAQAAARMARQMLARLSVTILGNPITWIVLGIICLIVIIIAIIFALYYYKGSQGKGPEMYPSTQEQIDEAQLVAALSGNSLAASQISNKVINYEKDRYNKLLNNLKNYGAPNQAAHESRLKEVLAQLDELKKVYDANNQTNIKKKRKEILKMMEDTEKALPFNDWISKKALEIWADETKNKSSYACKITGNMVGGEANVRKACASVVTVILVETGVPIKNCLSTMCLWQNKIFQLVVDRKPTIDRSLAKNSLSVLQPGDLVWWGDGGGSAPKGSYFNHVGIYVGNGEAVDNSSNNARVMKRSLDRKQGFNGAKRFVPKYTIDE